MKVSDLMAQNISCDDGRDLSGLPTYKLTEQIDLVAYQDTGLYTVLPLGMRVLNKIKNLIHEINRKAGIAEVNFPALQRKILWETSGRWKTFEKQIIEIASGYSSFIATPTNEEYVCNLLRTRLQSHKQLPLKFYQIGDIFKGNTPSKGVLRSLVFEVYEAYSLDSDEASLKWTRTTFEDIFDAIFSALELDIIKVDYPSGDFVNYLFSHLDGEHKILSENGRFRLWNRNDRCQASKAISIGMYKIYDRDFSKMFKLNYTDSSNVRRNPIMSTYGIGISRLLFAMVDSNRDSSGIKWKEGFEPFEYAIVTRQRQNQIEESQAKKMYKYLHENAISVLLDNRYDKDLALKLKSLRAIGIPKIILVNEHNLTNITLIENKSSSIQSINSIISEYIRR